VVSYKREIYTWLNYPKKEFLLAGDADPLYVYSRRLTEYNISAGEPKTNQAGKILPEDNKGKRQRESNEHTKISILSDVKSSWSQEKLSN
jgi:hypothetical protein